MDSSAKKGVTILYGGFLLKAIAIWENKSLNNIPLEVPPNAVYNQSETIGGTLSHRISNWKALWLRYITPGPVDFLNASLMRRYSESDTVMKKKMVFYTRYTSLNIVISFKTTNQNIDFN